MNKAKKNILLIIILIFALITILGFLWFARSTVTFPVIRTEEQAERHIKELYFYDGQYQNQELNLVGSCENDDFILYAYTIDGKLGYAMYEFVSLGRVSDNGCTYTADDYMIDIIKYDEASYLVMMRNENIGTMIANDEKSGAQIEFEPNGEAGIFMWKLEDEAEISYDIYDEQGNVIVNKMKFGN